MHAVATTRNSKVIRATPEDIYKAFTDPQSLPLWFAPGKMTAKIHNFELRIGGGYQMSLVYPESMRSSRGKSSDREDRYSAEFVELTPPRRIVTRIKFDTDEPSFAGEMTMEVTLEPEGQGTRVTILFRNIPSGISPEENEAGTMSTLERLGRFVE